MLLFWCCCFLPAVSLALPEFDIQTGKNCTKKIDKTSQAKLTITVVTVPFNVCMLLLAGQRLYNGYQEGAKKQRSFEFKQKMSIRLQKLFRILMFYGLSKVNCHFEAVVKPGMLGPPVLPQHTGPQDCPTPPLRR
jgi:hypothetical protein